MGREEYRLLLLFSQPTEQLHHLNFTWIVQKSRRLIQIDHRRLLRQCLSYHDLLTLAVTKCLNHPIAKRVYSYKLHRPSDNLLVLVVEGPPKARIGRTAHIHQFFHRHVLHFWLLCQYNTYHTAQQLTGVTGKGSKTFPVSEKHLTAQRCLKG